MNNPTPSFRQVQLATLITCLLALYRWLAARLSFAGAIFRRIDEAISALAAIP